jgi:Protein of unknown function, DUF599
MDNTLPWCAVLLSFLIVVGYEAQVTRAARRDPSATARSTHLLLRAQWVRALAQHEGSEIVAVQALRNSLMSATINASTAALAMMGSISLIESKGGLQRPLSVHVALEISLVATLFATYVCSALSMRFIHHAGFALSLPVGSAERASHLDLAVTYVQRGGQLYSWSLRFFLFAAPIVLGLIQPLVMPLGALVLLLVLTLFDRAPKPVKA